MTNLPATKASIFAKTMPEPNSGCWIWMGALSPKGYGDSWYQMSHIQAHRLSWILHFGPIPKGLWVLHKCDVRACINPTHLFLGSHEENMADMVAKERAKGHIGESNYRAKLTAVDIIRIRGDQRSDTVIAKDVGVAPGTISAIKRGDAWKHLPWTGTMQSPRPRSAPRRQLQVDDVSAIKSRIRNGEPHDVIAKDYGCSRSTISMIATGKNWGDIS